MIRKSIIGFYFFLATVTAFNNQNEFLNREKRTLIWPPGTAKIQVITGFGIPVDLKVETVIIGTVMKANYNLPTNVSDITQPYTTFERKKRAVSRWDIYSSLAQATEMRGLGGKSCVLRAICEVARSPFAKNYGLFHELLRVIFTPTTTKEKNELHADNEYYAAQDIGERNGKCDMIFKDCRASLMDMLSIYKD